MNFMRAILASLLSLVCTLAVSAYVTLQTLETTALNRTEVKTWLDKSGVYNNLLSTAIANNQTAQNDLNTGSSILSSTNLQAGLNQTFTPNYVKQAAEKAIDGAYNWLNGSASTISFEINTETQKDAFVSNLSAILEPQLAQLPRCTSEAQFDARSPSCLPPGVTAKQAADELATDAANQNSIFQKPLTATTLAGSTQGNTSQNSTSLTDNSTAQRIQSIVSNLNQWLLWLPIIAVISGGLMVLLSQHKLKAAKHLAGRLTIGLGITCAVGLLIATVGQNYSLKNLTGTNSATISQIVEPIVHQAAPAIGYRLALVSGLVGLATLIAWIVLLVIKRKYERAALLAPPEVSTVTAPMSPPAKSAPEELPKPTDPNVSQRREP